jgi:hypothetical protein
MSELERELGAIVDLDGGDGLEAGRRDLGGYRCTSA